MGRPDQENPSADTYLYCHFLEHTSRKSVHQRDNYALQVGLPRLALHNEAVLHSLLAVSAACLCCDLISQAECQPTAVRRVLVFASEHHASALQLMQLMITNPKSSSLDALLATATYLVPAVTAFQRISYWLVSRGEAGGGKLLSMSPRAMATLIRGIDVVLKVRNDISPGKPPESLDEPEKSCHTANLAISSSPDPPDGVAMLPPSRRHGMYSIISATNGTAFADLEQRIRSAFSDPESTSNGGSANSSISACLAAFEVLDRIRMGAFLPPDPSKATMWEDVGKSMSSRNTTIANLSPWLRSYVAHPAIPMQTEPLIRPFLAFLKRIPQTYLDLLFPLLDQRREQARRAIDGLDLSVAETLALDLYAHWLVLMLLIEDEAWYIGNLSIVWLRDLINTYGTGLNRSTGGSNGVAECNWWPGSMLQVATELRSSR